jgi:hypothetical protein
MQKSPFRYFPAQNTAKRSAWAALLLFALAWFSPAVMQAQFRGSLRGVVTDPQGAVIPGATVTLANKDTGQNQTATTDNNGFYIFNGLAPANYSLTVDATGFKQKVLEHVQLIPEQLNSLNVQLEVGGAAQTVTVSGTTQALDYETATVSATVNSNQIQHLPLVQPRHLSACTIDAGGLR